MGGNALKHMNPVRLTTVQLTALFNHIGRQLLGAFPRLHLVPWIDEKMDHGDVDIVIDADPDALSTLLTRFAECGAGKNWFVQNDKVLSVPFHLPWGGVAQVDFICAKDDAYLPACFFYSGGDFGMMLGRVAAWHGYVFGMDGLRLRADLEKAWMKDVVVTSSPSAILTFLGYGSRLPWFETYEQMWKFVMSSPLAHPVIFMPSSTNADNRSRDKQRPKIKAFQEWVKKNYTVCEESAPRRATFNEAYDVIRQRFSTETLFAKIQLQFMEWEDDREFHRAIGIHALQDVLKVPPATVDAKYGEVIKDMRKYLPPIKECRKMWKNRDTRPLLIRYAANAAFTACVTMGFPTRTPEAVFQGKEE